MSSNVPTTPSLKQRAKREFIDYAAISVYLAVFFCAMVTYTILLLKKYDVANDPLNYTFAIINALIVGKVILIGEMLRLAKHTETRPLYQSVLFKSVFYSLLVLAFHFAEEFIKRLIHGEPSGTVLHNINPYDLIGRSIVIFCAFIPLFAFRELRRILGEEKLHAIFFKHGAATDPGRSTSY